MRVDPLLAAAAAFVAVMLLGRVLATRRAGASPAASEPARRVRLTDRLAAAGIVSRGGIAVFAAAAALACLGGSLTGWWFVAGFDASPESAAVGVFLGFMAGAYLSNSWVESSLERRRLELAAEFPLMLDLLRICLQGGMSLPAAWAAARSSLDGHASPLSGEMRRIDLEISFGGGWAESLRSAGDRTRVAEFRSLGSMLDQTARYGAELSTAIGGLADSLRHEELQTLEERAHHASVKMLVPLAVLMLPATLLLMLGPMVVMLLNTLQGDGN